MLRCDVLDCQSPARMAAYCWQHGARFEAFGDPHATRKFYGHGDRLPFLSRLKEDAETGCWNWMGFIDRDGYGRAKLSGPHMAHRAAFLLFRGQINDESLDHLCRNRACCNPDHLEPVSMKVNTGRGETIASRYASRTHCDHGHEFTPDNTFLQNGYRACRRCRAAVVRRYRARRAALEV